MSLKNFFKIRVKKKINFYVLLGLIVLFFSAAYVHNNNIAFIAMFFLFAIGVVSFIVGRNILANTEVYLIDANLFANEEGELSFLVKYPFKKEVIKTTHVFKNRGYNEYFFELKSTFPFDLVEFRRIFKFDVLVYPEKKGKSLRSFFSLGNEMEEFSDLKKYSGESISKIHWPSVAKGEILVKKFSLKDEEKELVFDINKLPGSKEQKISQITKWVYEAKKRNLKFKVILDKEYKDYDEILKKLALY